MTCFEILTAARQELFALDSHLIDILDIKRPPSLEYAKNLATHTIFKDTKINPHYNNIV